MSSIEMPRTHRPRRRRAVVMGLLGVTLLGSGLLAATAEAANTSYPKLFGPEGANTFSTKTDLTPACPQALAGTPGSEPATKILNDALNTPANFLPGGTVHYIYRDNPHINPGTQNFTIQDCVVAYPPGTLDAKDLGPGGVLLATPKNKLTSGTPIDGASLSGIASAEGPIYFNWTSPGATVLKPDSAVCNFARDIMNNHGGDGNRKVTPTCYIVPAPGGGNPVFEPPAVYVGYADTFHGSSGTINYAPWGPGNAKLDPKLVYLGCYTTPNAITPDCGQLDAGAIRIDAGTNTYELTNASVEITDAVGGTCVFHPWDSLLPKTAGPGQSFVLTQTGTSSGVAAPPICAEPIDPAFWGPNNFDSSERPGDRRIASPGGEYFNCNPLNSPIPKVHLTFKDGGVLVDVNLTDLGQVLNTGGFDSRACPPNRNEAAPWTQIG